MGEVMGVDKKNKSVTLKNGDTLSFDYLVMAVGAKHSYFGKTEWERFAPGLKTLSDAVAIRENLLLSFEKAERLGSIEKAARYMNFVIIGGGPTGVEMAGAIAEISKQTLAKNFRHIDPANAQIYLVEALPRILPTYPEKLSLQAKKDLEKLGVKVMVNHPVTHLSAEGVEMNDLKIPTANIIWAAGNQAAAVLKTLDTPLDRQGRAVVEKDLSLPGFPHIFVIGDAASALDRSGKPLPGIAPVAMQQARYVAKLLKKEPAQRPPFSYLDKGIMATIGKWKAVVSSFGLNFSGIFAWLAWCFLHIFYLIGFKNRVSVMLQWLIDIVSGSKSARIIYRTIDEEPQQGKSSTQ
jgi:NADH dehydrogenase